MRPITTEEMLGISVFYKDADEGVHAHSSYARGNEIDLGAYRYLDLILTGRNETGPNRP